MFKKQLISLLLIISLLTPTAFATAYDRDGLIYDLYSQASVFKTDFTTEFQGDLADLGDMESLLEAVLEKDDYLHYSTTGYSLAYTAQGHDVDFEVSFKRKTTPEQEAYVDQFVTDTLKSLQLEGQSDYWRARKILEWVTSHYSYDDGQTIHDAYTMIMEKKGVCQAYALLYYKMAKGAGLQVRTQDGTLEGELHLWNLVKIGDQWFHVDPTNTNLDKGVSFFLKSNSYMANHDFSWYKLVEPAVESDAEPDKYFTSGDYSEAKIQERIKSNAFIYAPSETAEQALAKAKELESYRTALKQAMDAFAKNPSKKNFDALKVLRDKASEPNGELERQALSQINAGLAANDDAMYALYLTYYNSAKKGQTGGTEKGRLDALALAKTTSAKLKAEAYQSETVKSYLVSIDSNSKIIASSLTQYYIGKAATLKSKVYKDKALALAKAYGLNDLYKKASAVKVK